MVGAYNKGMKSLKVMREKDGARGLVPARAFGNNDRVYKAYLDKLDPRHSDKVQESLAVSKDPRFREFLERISMSRYKRFSLPTIAKGCNIDLAEFQSWWQKEATQQAIAVAQTRSIELVEHMAGDAMSSMDVCPRCDGLKFVAAPDGLSEDEIPGYRSIKDGETLKWIRDCPKCQDGKIRKIGDTHARDRLLEMSGIIQKGKSGITLVQNFGGAGHASAMSQLDDMMTIDVTAEVMD